MKNISENRRIRVIGTSVSEGNMALLERLTIAPEERPEKLRLLKEKLGVSELLYLPTCNRVEFVVACAPEITASQIRNRLLDFFFADGRDFEFSPSDFYELSAASAIRHVFRVVSALESLVIGETQITGQFKSAFVSGRDQYNMIGEFIEPLAEEALLVAKQVRNETNLGSGALSMASLVMIELEADGPLPKDYTIALIGSGEMSRKMAAYLGSRGVENILFVNRTLAKAEALAEKHNGRAIVLADFIERPEPVDAIVSATSATNPIFCGEFLQKLTNGVTKENSHIVCVDLAIPRDFSVEFQGHRGIRLIDISHLTHSQETNLRQKFVEVDSATELIDSAVSDFQRSQIERTLRPVLRRSYQESLDFALENCDKLLKNRLSFESSETEALVKDLLKKVVGFSSARFAHAVSEHLSNDFENHRQDDICQQVGRESAEATGAAEVTDVTQIAATAEKLPESIQKRLNNVTIS